MDNGLNAFEGIIFDVNIFQGFAHTGDHPHQVLHITHFLDLLQLREEVVKVELVLSQFFLQLAGFFFIKLFLCFFDQRHDVAHTQDTIGHTFGMEQIDGIHFFANTHKLDGLAHHRADGQGCPAAGIPVEFGKHHPVEVEAVVEGLSGIHGILTRHGIHHKEGLLGIQVFLQGRDLIHHLGVDGQTAGGIHDNHLVAHGLGVGNSLSGNTHRILAAFFCKHFYAHLLAQHLQLVNGRRTINVACHQQNLLAFLRLQVIGKLGRECCLTATLQTCDEDDGRTAFDVDFFIGETHQTGQLFVNDFHHQLAGGNRCKDILPQRLFLHCVGKGLGNLKVHVGIEQRPSDILQGLCNIDLTDVALPLEQLKRPVELIT